MITTLYVIFDKAAGSVIGGVLNFPHDAVAVRQFGEIASNPQTDVCKYPDDFELRAIGTVDLVTLETNMFDRYQVVMSAALFKAMQAEKGVSA